MLFCLFFEVMRKKIGIGILVMMLLFIAVYFYVYKDHRNISTEEESYTMDVKTLFSAYQNNETAADSKYLNKTIVVDGAVSMVSIETQSVVLDEKLFAVFSTKLVSGIRIKSNLKIKGRLIGYDSLLEQIKMDQCVILN